MHNFCTQNNILSDSQFGFSLGLILNPLISTSHLCKKTFTPPPLSVLCFLILAIILISFLILLLLDSLSSLYVPPILLYWYLFYLSNLSQQAVVNGLISDSTFVTLGVPQGSFLGPLLFILSHLATILLSYNLVLTLLMITSNHIF